MAENSIGAHPAVSTFLPVPLQNDCQVLTHLRTHASCPLWNRLNGPRGLADDPAVTVLPGPLPRSASRNLGLGRLRDSGVLVLKNLAEERFPEDAYFRSRHLPPAEIWAFPDFVGQSVAG
jgi:hypothetical protein